MTLLRKPSLPVRPAKREEGGLWAIVLAGGEGLRLRSLTRHLYGEDRPKQYAALLESRSLLRQTLDRVALLIPPERTVVVTLSSHARFVDAELRGSAVPRVLAQPCDRGTAAGVLLPAHWILARDPLATVVVFPSDHVILEEAAFMGHVAEVARFVNQHRDWTVLLGAQPTEPEAEYGWIEPAEPVGWTGQGPLYRIRRFQEKPSREVAEALFQAGCLWNTFVFAVGAATLIEAGQKCLPSLHDRLARIVAFAGTEHEGWAIQHGYALAPTANFSRSILEACPVPLAVSKVPALFWCDLGTPDRVAKTLQRLGASPSWPGHSNPPGRHAATKRG
jgi:mannose-1-phosphate guanylyltransferase